jgi:outer membrane protein assembly factor BamA
LNRLKTFFVISAVALLMLLSGCSAKKYVGDSDHLIKKYTVSVDGKHPEISSSELRTLCRPKPNSKTVFFRAKLYYYFRHEKKPTRLNTWLNKHFGEPPAYYTVEEADAVTKNMIRYLNNTGFFYSEVSHTVSYRKKTAKVHFHIKPAKPYRIKSIKYDIPDTTIRRLVFKNIDKSLIKSGDIYNAYTFDDERDRLAEQLRNQGYYFFNRNYIQFVIDSNFNDKKMQVTVLLNNIKKPDPLSPGDFNQENHKRYTVNKIFVNPEYIPGALTSFDTIIHQIDFWQDTNTYNYYFLYGDKLNIQPNAFNAALKIKPGKFYSANSVQQTYRKLFNYQIIRSANINFDTLGTGEAGTSDKHYLNAHVMLQDNKLNLFSAELEGTNASGDLGIRGNLVFMNRNIFRRAEVLRIRLKGGTEAQTVSSSESGNSLFNTYEAGIDGTFFFPRFLFPFRLDKFNQRYIPNTNINFGYNYQLRSNYSRNITNIDLGYSWNSSKVVSHILTPINLNYVRVMPSPEFDSILNNETNRRLREQYSDHMIAGLNYSFIFNNQSMVSLKHFNYLRINIETSGNLATWLYELSGTPRNDSGFYSLIGVRYSQYIRTSIDFRHYYYFFEKSNALVFRFLAGAGIPYGNSDELPYEKGFYAGGANDMRGWQFRSLGPGSYSGTSTYERIGDIQLEGNIEYRFPVYSFFKGALFADVGNIWTYNTSTTFPGGQFKINEFYKQLALDAGVGFRFDFQFFIFRIDAAAPLRNPAYPTGETWRFRYLQVKDFVFSFGIGYPF